MTKRTNKQYLSDFKQEVVALVTQQGYSVVEAAASLNVTDKLLYNWVAKFKQESEESALSTDERAELIISFKTIKVSFRPQQKSLTGQMALLRQLKLAILTAIKVQI